MSSDHERFDPALTLARLMSRHSYVARTTISEPTPWGDAVTCRGWLGNGAGRKPNDLILDLIPEAHLTHDRLYVLPYVGGKRRCKTICDLTYGIILNRYRKTFPRLFRRTSHVVRPVVLVLLGWGAWRGCRQVEAIYCGDGQAYEDAMLAAYVIPHLDSWHLQSWRLRDARWIGPGPQ